MARRAYYTEPWQKHLEVFQDFSGGMNTMTAQDNMRDNEFSNIVNMDIDMRGAIRRRNGILHEQSPVLLEGKIQGYFRHYSDYKTYKTLIARNGQLEVDGTIVPGISFQTERDIDAVQYGTVTYIATGTKLLQFDGTDVKVVEAYKPKYLELLYVGTNSLADDPPNHFEMGEGATFNIGAVTFDKRYGIMAEPFTLTAHFTTIPGEEYEFKFEYRYPFMEDGKWVLGQDWSSKVSFTRTEEGEGDVQFRVTGRKKGLTVASAECLVPHYKIKATPDANDIEEDYKGVHRCNKILLHWDRLVLYGDTTNFNTVYFSHLKNPGYVPTPNNLRFETTRNEPVRSIVRFRDYLLVFTDTSIQALFGKGPSDFRRVVLNTSIGCIAPNTVVVMDNYVVFLSAEGVYYLKSVGYVDDKANVAKLDIPISNIMFKDENASAVMYNEYYTINFPDRKVSYRYHKVLQSWIKDESPYFDFQRLYNFEQDMWAQRTDGQIVRFDNDTYADLDHIYEAVWESRYLDFSQPYHIKKLKELQMFANAETKGRVAHVTVTVDGASRIENIYDWEAKFDYTEDYNTFLDKLKVSGKCHRARVTVVHPYNEYASFLGFAFILKVKKP